MSNHPSATEAIVRNHLQAFLEQQGIAAILSDYDDDARFHSEVRTYRGKQEIGSFFEDFIASLPPAHHALFPVEPIFEYDCSTHPLRNEIVTEPLQHVGGWLEIPSIPGLGIEINREALQQFAAD